MHSWERIIRRTKKTGTVWVLSVQHTGTWFVLDLLKNHPDFPRLTGDLDPIPTRLQQFETIRNGDIVSSGIIHAHVGDWHAAHVSDARKFVEGVRFLKLSKAVPVLTPLRDPLAAMITRHARHPMLDARYLVDGFVWLAQGDSEASYLRVDVEDEPRNYQSRLSSLRNALRAVGINAEVPIVNRWAREWPARNVSGDTWLKVAYRNRDPGPIRDEMPEEWEHLRSKRAVLRPFLERHGYRSLLWW